MKKYNLILLVCLLAASLSCQSLAIQQPTTQVPPKTSIDATAVENTPVPAGRGRVYTNDAFEFRIPAGWMGYDELWGRPQPAGVNYYGLGVITITTIQYPAVKGKGEAFFSVASSPSIADEQLEQRFNQAYENPTPAIKDAVRQTRELKGLTGFEITYSRPWGEGWWRFRDIWVEKDAVVYVLSFHSTPGAFDRYSETLNQTLESFSFKN